MLALVNGSFNAKIVPLDKANLEDNLTGNRIFITSTFGNGDPPEMATGLQSWLQRKTQEEPVRKTLLKNYVPLLDSCNYSIFALGSTAYPNFCGFGKWLDVTLDSLGAKRLNDIAFGDDLGDAEAAFKAWANGTHTKACKKMGLIQFEQAEEPKTILRWHAPSKDKNNNIENKTDSKIDQGQARGIPLACPWIDPRVISVTPYFF